MDFVVIANAWGAGADNPTSKHRIALELARRGHRVLWVEGAGMRRPSLGSGGDRGRVVRKLRQACRGVRQVAEGIWVVAPLLLPLPAHGWIRRLNGWLYRRVMGRCWRRLGFERPVLINYVPVLAEAMKKWHGGKVVYHCVDRWDAFEMYDSVLMADVDRRCCDLADIVIATSQDLYARCQSRCPICRWVMHGVDHDHFASALGSPDRPADMPGGATIGFFGLLSEWIDQELVVRLAEATPDTPLVLIGKADVDVRALARVPNIHLLGPKPFDELPDYIAHFRVGIIPFVVNDLTRAVNPIKLREMLAAGCPVVSTDLPEVKRIAECRIPNAECRVTDSKWQSVVVAGTADAFVAAVKERLTAPCATAERRAISASVAAETWEAKVNEILETIEG